MKILARLLWGVAALLIAAALAAWLLACWAGDDTANRLTNTGFVLLFASVAAFGGGALADYHAKEL